MSCKVNYAERMGEYDQAMPARRPRMTADAREAMIVAAAIRVVAEEGFDISVRDLALRIGVPHSVLFRHFPSKDALIKRIYDEVFVARLEGGWPALLMDEAVPLAERLLTFYRAYTAAIFDPIWVRIFLFAGLKGTSLNADYFRILKTQVLEPICLALRQYTGRDTQDGPSAPAEMEQARGLHGRIFYLAIRQHVYRRRAPVSETMLSDAIEAFLESAKHSELAALQEEPCLASVAPGMVALPRRMSSKIRRRAIIDGAIPFFAKFGFKGQMRELACHLGITHSLLFHYFPQKQDLIDKVYAAVFERPWRALGPPLADEAPLREKLVAFYCAYLAIVDRNEWIRIFISAGLHDAGLCGHYLDLIEKDIIDVIAETARKLIDAPDRFGLHEDAWGLHGQIVYSAIRNHIYDMPTPASRQTTVGTAVAVFMSSLEMRRGRLQSANRDRSMNG